MSGKVGRANRGFVMATILGIALLSLVLAALVGPRLIRYGEISPLTNPTDFRAFYCAGSVLASGGNALTIEPLRSCEQRATREMGLQPFPLMVNPAPQPPFALLAFAGIAHLGFPAASCVWLVFLLLCTVVTARALRTLTGLPLVLITLVVFFGNFLAMLSGELGPLVVAAIVSCADAIVRKRPLRAIVFAAIASVVPNVALPIWIALGLFRSETRRYLFAIAVVLAIAPAIAFGPGIWVDYFGRELPAHALSETRAFGTQYSLTTVLAALGVSERVATILGELQYAVMIVIGVMVAKRLSERLRRPDLLVCVPPVFTALGGIYVHLYQLAILIPAALVLVAVSSRRLRVAMVCAMAFLIGGIAVNLACSAILRAETSDAYLVGMRALGPNDLASSAIKLWHESISDRDPRAVATMFLLKIPATTGLTIFVIATTWAAFSNVRARRRDIVSLVSPVG